MLDQEIMQFVLIERSIEQTESKHLPKKITAKKEILEQQLKELEY